MTASPMTPPESLQDLLAKWAHFCLYIERFITHDLAVDLEGKHLVVGVSGGVDSTALLLVLHYLAPKSGFTLTAAHLNHQLRDEADEDAQFVEELCTVLGVPCIIDSADIATIAENAGVGLEEAGRNIRYQFYKKVLQGHKGDLIAVGHHLDDLTEDVVMRFIRGTGWPGLAGMPGYDPDRNLIRPLLMLPKSTMKAFVTYCTIEWREDASNNDPSMTRNRIRNELVPLLLKENPNFREAMGRLWRIGCIESDYWETQTSDAEELLPNEKLESAHLALRLRLYKVCLDKIGPGQVLAHTLFKLDEAYQEQRLGTVFQFPGDKTATISKSGVVFSTKH